MRSVDVKNLRYRDNLASKRRQRRHVWAGLIITGVIAFIATLGYLLFYSPWMRVNVVEIEGLSEPHQAQVRKIADQSLERKVLGIPIGGNLFFVRGNLLATNLRALGFLEEVNIQKKFFHTLKIIGKEKQADGTWCWLDRCRYFDHNGTVWGETVRSTGFLVLNIDDEREASGSFGNVDQQFLKAIQLVVSALSEEEIKTKSIIIPAGGFTEFDVLVNNPDAYVIKFSLDSDLLGQLKTYQIFRSQKLANNAFHPQYIDLRFDGRVYFK